MCSRGLKIFLVVSLLFLATVFTAIVVLFFTILKPRDPVITLHLVDFQHFQLSDSFLYKLTKNSNISLQTVISMKNPNYGSFKYGNSSGYVKFHDMIVGVIPIKGDLIPARSQINMNTSINLMLGKLVNAYEFLSDFANGTLNLRSRFILRGKACMLKIIKLKTRTYTACKISLKLPYNKEVNSICKSKLQFDL
ncbi:hypothetical protein VNO78_13972 [Psophocarpus tetragonolobus]|uniref:Late embryogenesis abundant protein LEA-2 subgroup domain-containing protein n=1 Tax=Psophocarpus tetragonolobus TaxID=3891 RepID=A0AAN9SQP3_PSOTE